MPHTIITSLPDGRYIIKETIVEGYAERTLFINPDGTTDEDWFFDHSRNERSKNNDHP